MGLYAFFLAGSNYFAPVICGFIAEYHGWEWVFYWPATFCGASMVILFFLMEETNHAREKPVTGSDAAAIPVPIDESTKEKGRIPSSSSDPEIGVVYMRTYLQKLAILGPRQARNNMFRRSWQTVYYLSWPVIFYAGCVSHYPRRKLT